jgi:hypothetical protein
MPGRARPRIVGPAECSGGGTSNRTRGILAGHFGKRPRQAAGAQPIERDDRRLANVAVVVGERATKRG